MKEYLVETPLLDYKNDKIEALIEVRGWRRLDSYHQIEAIYSFVKDEILFGFNDSDVKKASEVLADGYGQCNTKSALLMALLRGVGIPCRHHVFLLSSALQISLLSKVAALFAPKQVVHTWVEVWYQGEWLALEGVIIDQAYLEQIQKKFLKEHELATKDDVVSYTGYAIATMDLFHPQVTWVGKSTYIQNKEIQKDLGIYASYDESFQLYGQNLCKIKTLIYKHITCKQMTKKVQKIRLGR